MDIISKYIIDFNSTSLEENIKLFFVKFGKLDIFIHTTEVVLEVERLALSYDLDVDKCKVAAYMHDLGRVVNHEEMAEFCSVFGHKFQVGEVENPSIIHQIASKILAREVFGVEDIEILNAIAVHTTLKANASHFEMAVFLADKLSRKEDTYQSLVFAMNQLANISLNEAVACYFNNMYENKAS